MRLWSLHPKYLDAKGLVALWRESLLALHVLEGKTKGYKSHSQLQRFKSCSRPVAAIHQYLAAVYDEAVARNYHFDASKFKLPAKSLTITVTRGQLDYEAKHLLAKLKTRDKKRLTEYKNLPEFDAHPLFKIIKGEIEEWEVVK